MSVKFDLHSHSHFSDGKLSPQELVDYALARNIDVLALTDHDSIDGINHALETIQLKNLPMRLVKGVEISALTEFGEIHIVGLGVDTTNQLLIRALHEQQTKRWTRAEDISNKLAKLGVSGVLEWCQKNVIKVVTRTHIASAIVSLGFAKDQQQAFKKFIGKQGKIKVAKDWMTLTQAIDLIHAAGGLAVLAHPSRYPLSNRKLSYLIQNFAENNGDAIELSYPSLNADKLAWLKIQREANQLLASSGSDFHYPDLRWTDMGRFQSLDADIPHVITKLI